MFYDIVQVIPNEDYTVYVYFEDGKIVCYDAKTLLKKKVFEPLKDINFFMNACTILNGTLAWDVTGTRDCISIACLVIIFVYGIIMKGSPLQLILIFLPVIYAMLSTRE